MRFSLAYKGDIDSPREGDKIVASLDTPEQKWRLGAGPGRYNMLVYRAIFHSIER